MQTLNSHNCNITNTYPAKVLQFGGGNFLRGFVDWIIDQLNEKGGFQGSIIVVKATKEGNYQVLKNQDGLYHVVLDGIKNSELHHEIRLITCISRVLHAYQEWDAFISTASIPSLRFVTSNTTEAGIVFNPEDTRDDAPPKEFPAKLTLWLYHRFEVFKGDHTKGCIILPCELINQNGLFLKDCILKYAEAWDLDPTFAEWIHYDNYFCNTLVDRIVSGFPHARIEQLTESLGFNDRLLVAGEHYHSWIIEAPKNIQKEFPLDNMGLNIRFVDDLSLYRKLKVRILNGAHTAMVPIGYLIGLQLVEEAITNDRVASFIKSLLSEEVAPTIDLPGAVINSYINEVLDRFRNPTVHHQLISIALNSTTKFTTRLWPSLIDYYKAHHKLPTRIIFSLAALIRFYKGSLEGEQIALNDNERSISFIKNQWNAYEKKEITLYNLSHNILINKDIWGRDLSTIKSIVDETSIWLSNFEKVGLSKSLDLIQ